VNPLSNTDSGSYWLQAYIEASVAADLCVSISCTTCGAVDFRKGLLHELAQSSGDTISSRMDAMQASAIAKALAGLVNPREAHRYEKPIRLILFDICNKVGEAEVAQILKGTWSGGILQDMQAHQRAEVLRHRNHAEKNDPEAIEKRREEKRRMKAEKHASRLAAKIERDRHRREGKLND
jgi:hypothetical protein